MYINVTQYDILRADSFLEASKSPVAFAIQASLPGAIVFTTVDQCYVDGIRYDLPVEASMHNAAFMRGDTVKPISFYFSLD